jgi:hypothetical protein
MSNKTYLLSLNGDTFNSFKLDFDNALQRLLTRMDKLQRDSGSITCKIDVQLKEDAERNLDSASEGDTVPVMRPVFSHDISTEIKVKDKTTGLLAGNHKLVWDEQLHEYVMKDIDDGQTTLFDTASDNTTAQPPETPQLPESVVDVDYTVISDDKGYILRNPGKCGIEHRWGILMLLVGEHLTIDESAGHCYSQLEDGTVALGSAYLAADPRYVPEDILRPHLHEEITCNSFGSISVGDHEEPAKITVECLDCGGILLEEENPEGEEA